MKQSELIKKLALGTVQLGLPYGVIIFSGKPDQHESFGFLSTAWSKGIDLLDSAEAYGDSQQVIGSFIESHPEANFSIVSKFSSAGPSISDGCARSLHQLRQSSIYAYLYHRFADYQGGEVHAELCKLKRDGYVKKIGISLYGEEELLAVLDDDDIELIQIPFNIFDASPTKQKLLLMAKQRGKEIHVRSVFLQGLFFKQPESLPGPLKGVAPALRQLQNCLERHSIDVMTACLNHALHAPFIDRVVIGVERTEQLLINLSSIREELSESLTVDLARIEVADRTLLNPANWNTPRTR